MTKDVVIVNIWSALTACHLCDATADMHHRILRLSFWDAASLQAALDAFLSQKAATEVDEAAESQNSSDEEQTGTVAGSDVRKLRLLNAALLQAQHSPAIRAMPAEQVRQVLQQLSKWIGLARDAQLIKGEEVSQRQGSAGMSSSRVHHVMHCSS